MGRLPILRSGCGFFDIIGCCDFHAKAAHDEIGHMVAHAHDGRPTMIVAARFAPGFIAPVVSAGFAAVIGALFPTGFFPARFIPATVVAARFFTAEGGCLNHGLDCSNLRRFFHARPTVTPATAAT